jgi:hypothetical protein
MSRTDRCRSTIIYAQSFYKNGGVIGVLIRRGYMEKLPHCDVQEVHQIPLQPIVCAQRPTKQPELLIVYLLKSTGTTSKVKRTSTQIRKQFYLLPVMYWDQYLTQTLRQ